MDAARLRTLPLFSSLSRREVRKVAQWADELDVPEGTELAKQGDFAHEFLAWEEPEMAEKLPSAVTERLAGRRSKKTD